MGMCVTFRREKKITYSRKQQKTIQTGLIFNHFSLRTVWHKYLRLHSNI